MTPSVQLVSFVANRKEIWRADPNYFFHDMLKFEPDAWQAEAARQLGQSPRVAIKSGQGVGKTAFEAAIFLWFICCFPYARVVATAPTKNQLHDVLWSEISKWMNQNPILPMMLKWTKTYVYMIGYEKRWFGVARTAAKPENMQGFHEDNMLFIVDEASGVADPIMEAILGTLSGANNKLLLCGNPTRTSGTFYDAFTRDSDMYKKLTVSSLDSTRTNKENIQSMIRKYGENSNVVKVRVYGSFPDQEDDVFLPYSWLEGSIHTELEPETAKALGTYVNEKGEKVIDRSGVHSIDIGCDVARFGDDRTVIGYKLNECAKIYKKYNGQDTVWTTGNIIQLFLNLTDFYGFTGYVDAKVDDGGVGGGVTDQLREHKRRDPERFKKLRVWPINFGQTIKHKIYYDTTTYMMGILREHIEPFDKAGVPRKPTLILPNDDDMIGQLSCRKYGFVGGKLKVESKKEMKERGLSSPDEGDCMLLTCYPIDRKGR